jgi:hypothetical protein
MNKLTEFGSASEIPRQRSLREQSLSPARARWNEMREELFHGN